MVKISNVLQYATQNLYFHISSINNANHSLIKHSSKKELKEQKKNYIAL